MKKGILFYFILLSVVLNAVNGELQHTDDRYILKVWGTHYERGYAQGYLLAENIKLVWSSYIYNSVFYHNSPAYNSAVNFVSANFVIEEKYHNEAQGLIDGIRDTLGTAYCDELGRDFNKNDILFVNSLVDYVSVATNQGGLFGCSSLSAWGEATEQSSLNGNLVITRFMDWQPNSALLLNHLLMVQIPSEEDETPWISFGFPGLFGALSAINSFHVTSFMNMGNIDVHNNLHGLHPIWFSARNGIEMIDYNNDGTTDKSDVYQSVFDKLHSGGFIVQTSDDNSSYVLETNNVMGTLYRSEEDNTIIPSNLLLATNHFRKLYDPVACYRYQAVSDSLNQNSNISIERSWDVMCGGAGITYNIHAIGYVPSLDLIKWSVAQTGTPAYTSLPQNYDLQELFTLGSATDTNVISEREFLSYPNPVKKNLNIKVDSYPNELIKIDLYNLKGQKIKSLTQKVKNNSCIEWNCIDKNNNEIKSGKYFYKISYSKGIKYGKFTKVK